MMLLAACVAVVWLFLAAVACAACVLAGQIEDEGN